MVRYFEPDFARIANILGDESRELVATCCNLTHNILEIGFLPSPE
jgi:hypothetical protein